MTIVTLEFNSLVRAGEVFHISRAELSTSRPRTLHNHDFHELLWVQNGTLRNHLARSRRDLGEGDLVFVRPADRHALQARGSDCYVVAVQFDAGFIADLRRRHPMLEGRFFWSDAAEPVQVHRDSRQMADLNHAALRLERGRRDGLEAEAFLLPLLNDLLDAAQPLPAGAPDWLATACAAAQDPKVFRDGAAGFARVAGKAHPHVSRTVRKFLDQSPSDFVNAQRMTFAARRLTGSADPLSEIAADCGIPNLSHFHKLFRAHHGMTPLRYRKSRQIDVMQPR